MARAKKTPAERAQALRERGYITKSEMVAFLRDLANDVKADVRGMFGTRLVKASLSFHFQDNPEAGQ